MILDLYAGAGGWTIGARMIGLDDIGIEWDEHACATRAANGMATIRADLGVYPPEPFVGKVDTLVASPPCQTFSMAGKGSGRAAMDLLVEQILDEQWQPDELDERTAHVLHVGRWCDTIRPRVIIMEQVPPVRHAWAAYVQVFERWGYSAWSGVLNCADYGVPQTRKRAFLIARRDGLPGLPPEPTHSSEPSLTTQPWVTMAEALGWDGTLGYKRGAGITKRSGARPPTPTTQPAPTMTASNLRAGGGAKFYVEQDGQRRPVAADEAATLQTFPTLRDIGRNGAVRGGGEPAMTICGSHDNGNLQWDPKPEGRSPGLSAWEAQMLQTFPDGFELVGNKAQRFMQIGNAVPPMMAAAILDSTRP